MARRSRRKVIIKRTRRRLILHGLARIFDFRGSVNAHKKSLPPHIADKYALWADWKVVGDVLRVATGDHSPNGVDLTDGLRGDRSR